MPVSVVPTKIIIPKRPDGVLHRPRLTDYLHENLERKLMLVTAPAGYGKTTLLIDFAEDVEMPVCWYTLDEGDRDLAVFLAHLLASLQRHFPHFGQRTQPLVESGVPAVSAAAAALVADMVSDILEYFILVLDDWHLVSDEGQIRDLIDHVLRYLPEHAHLIVAGRTLLRGPLVRLAAQGAVAGIGAADLRFTGSEVRDVLASRFNLAISTEQAARFAIEAEGWITAILLTSNSVWQDVLGRLAQVRDSAGTLYEYLASEVFDRLDTALQDFLLASAVPRQFTVELCNELCGDGAAADWIEQVEARNLFLIQLEDAGERWYRYHHLFREFLLTRLQRRAASRFTQLQRQAGAAFEARQQTDEAVEHFLAAGESERAAHIMQAMARPLFISGRRQTLRTWYEQLPAQYHSLAPELLFYHGQALIERGQLSDALPLLHQAEAGFAARGDWISQLRARLPQGWEYYARSRFVDAQQLGQQILQEPAAQQDLTLTAEALRLVGDSEYGLGRWPTAETLLTHALSMYRQTPEGERRAYNLGRTLQDLANVLRSMGRLEEAATLQVESLTMWRKIGNPGPLARCLNNLGFDRYVAGDYEGALKLYREALTKAEEVDDRPVQAYLLEGMAAAQRDRGESRQALETYQQAFNLGQELGDLSLTCRVLDGLGHTHRLLDELERAEALFEQAHRMVEREQLGALTHPIAASIGIMRVERGQLLAGLADLEQVVRVMRGSDSYLELGRSLFWLARAYFLNCREKQSQDALLEVVRLGQRLGCRPFALAEARRDTPFALWALGQLDDGLLRHWFSSAQRDTAPLAVRVAPVESPPVVRALALGAGQVWRDGQLLGSTEWGGSALARELFFYLLANSPQRKEEIGATFWPNLSPGRMTSAFHAAKYKARHALGIEFVVFDDAGYVINPAVDIWYDVAEFQRLLASAHARSSTDPDRVSDLQQAIQLYSGSYLTGSYAEWTTPLRDQLQTRYFDSIHLLIDIWLPQQQYQAALAVAQRGLDFDYYREDLHRVVMQCLADTGQATRALKHFETLRRRLLRELNTPPDPETQLLVKQIRANHGTRRIG
jgi:LuxR family maltose regulon positive regulatory protein